MYLISELDIFVFASIMRYTKTSTICLPLLYLPRHGSGFEHSNDANTSLEQLSEIRLVRVCERNPTGLIRNMNISAPPC